VRRGQRFLITSHSRPDGDSIGSQLAFGFALDALGKTWRIVNRDAPPPHFRAFPGIDRIEVAESVEGDFDVLFVMECSDLARPGVAGLGRYRAVNIDHHAGNANYGILNWYDDSAAACGEMVADLIDALGVPLTRDIATHVYLAVLTDTGGFRHSNITARTFELCRRAAEAGVDAAAMARQVYDTGTIGRLKLIGALLDHMQLEAAGRVAVLTLSERMLRETQAAYSETDGLINLPLTSESVHAVVMFKEVDGQGELRVSLRSKGDIDVRRVAQRYGGGGHKNASGFTAPADDAATRAQIVANVVAALGN
jgi:phosphoesterase RecJ-like protein